MGSRKYLSFLMGNCSTFYLIRIRPVRKRLLTNVYPESIVNDNDACSICLNPKNDESDECKLIVFNLFQGAN